MRRSTLKLLIVLVLSQILWSGTLVEGAIRVGTVCDCYLGSGGGCQNLYVRFKPGHERGPRPSYIQEDKTFQIKKGQTLPLVVVQLMKGTSEQGNTEEFYNAPTTADNLETVAGNGVTLSQINIIPTFALPLGTSTPTATWDTATSAFTNGVMYITGISLGNFGLDGDSGSLEFVFSNGLNLTSNLYKIYQKQAATVALERYRLIFEPTGYLYDETFRLGGPTDLKSLVVGYALPKFTVTVADIMGSDDIDKSRFNTKTMEIQGHYTQTSVDAGFGNSITNEPFSLLNGSAVIDGLTATFEGVALPAGTVSASFTLKLFVNEFSGDAAGTGSGSNGGGTTEIQYTSTQELRASSTPVAATFLSLMGSQESFLNTEATSTKYITEGISIPPVKLILQTSAFQDDRSISGIAVVAHSDEAQLRTEGSVVTVVDGEAIFDQLVFTSSYSYPSSVYGGAGGSPWPVSVTFTAGRQGILAVQGRSLISPTLNLKSSLTNNRSSSFQFRRHDSYLTVEGQSQFLTVEEGIADQKLPPIIFEIFDDGNRRRMNSGDVITVVATPAGALSGTKQVTSNRGLVVFDNLYLRFSGYGTCEAAECATRGGADASTKDYFSPSIQFEANLDGNRFSLAPNTIYVVRPLVPEVSLRFEEFPTSLVTQEGADYFATQQVPLPSIVVEVLNSRGEVDVTSNELEITGTSNVFITNSRAITHRGRAVFPRMTFGSSGVSRVSFTAKSSRGAPVDGKSIATGYFNILEQEARMFRLKFHPNGYIQFSGQRVRASESAPLPRTGVQIVTSSHTVESNSTLLDDLKIYLHIDGGGAHCTPGSSVVSSRCGPYDFNLEDSTAWINGVTLVESVVSETRALRFSCEYAGTITFESTGNEYRPLVLHTSIQSGEVYFANTATDPMTLMLTPAQVNETDLWGNSRSVYLNMSYEQAGGENENRDGVEINDQTGAATGEEGTTTQQEESNALTTPITEVFIGKQFQRYLYRRDTVIKAGLELYAADGTVAQNIPVDDASRRITATSTDLLKNSTAFLGVVNDSSVPIRNATFSSLQFQPETFLTDFFTLLTFTSSWSSFSSFGTPLRVGPFYYDALQTALDEPVVVVEVALIEPVFSLDRWLTSLAEIAAVNLNRIEVVKVRPTGTATIDYALTFKGTRVEFKFLSPGTDSTEKASSRQLAETFLAIETESCRIQTLRIHRKYYREQQPTCDVYQVEDQLHAARRCISTSSPAERCNCHVPMFQVLGEKCKGVGQMQLVCSELQRCDNDLINDICFEFELKVYLLYLRIGAAVIGTMLLFIIIYLYKIGAIGKRSKNRHKLRKGRETEKVSLRVQSEDVGDAYGVLVK